MPLSKRIYRYNSIQYILRDPFNSLFYEILLCADYGEGEIDEYFTISKCTGIFNKQARKDMILALFPGRIL